MATSESMFKSQFRKDLARHYHNAVVFTNNDMFTYGLPDFSVLWQARYFGVEAKFVDNLPKRGTSKCLKHEVSVPQVEFLKRARETGNHAVVLIGLPDVAVVMQEIKSNYTLDEVLQAMRFERTKGKWLVGGFLELVAKWGV